MTREKSIATADTPILLLDWEIMQGDVGRLVLTHKDRLLRFGAELVFAMCEEFETKAIFINKTSVREASPTGEEITFEQELVQDMIELITVFSARLYGSRSKKNKNMSRILPIAGRSPMTMPQRFGNCSTLLISMNGIVSTG